MNQPSWPCPTVGLSFTIILAAASSAWAEVPPIAITEWMYAGNGVNGGEFIEFTNISDAPVDMTGWSFDDDHRVPGTFDLSAFGIVEPGESVIVTEDPAEVFRSDWNLPRHIKIIGNLGNPEGNNLGRNDEINLYDDKQQLVDRLTYGDQDFPGSIRTRWFSGNPAANDALGANDPYLWVLASNGDAYGSWTSANGDVGNPGAFNLLPTIKLPLYINEVVASNNAGLADEDGDYEDWIELYNAGERPINLDGFGLSDNYSNPFKWVFPAITIEPGEFLVVFASNKDRTDPEGELHTNFAISASGEEVLLTHPSGVRLDELEPTPIPTDISLGRQPDGTGPWLYFDQPTPGSANITQGYEGLSSDVAFSHQAGFYTDGFELTLSSTDDDAVIYYTLNGDAPSPGSASTHVYTSPITIESRVGDPNDISMIPTNDPNGPFGWKPPTGEVFKVTPVRAVAIRPDALPSRVLTRTYLVDDEIKDKYTFPVISLNTDRDNFFDYDIGIYVPGVNYIPGNSHSGNYTQGGVEWERPVHIEFFESDQSLAFAQDAGVRIHGSASRRLPQKSLRLYARNSYSTDSFEHVIFPDQPQFTSYRRLILRAIAQDNGRTGFRDEMVQGLFAEIDQDTQAYRPAVVFLNGEYWGIHNIRERHDRHYLARTHDVDPDELDFLENFRVVRDGTVTQYDQLLNFLSAPPYSMPDTTTENDLIHPENYEQLRTMMDVDQFLTYIAAQVYIRNHDWPQNNIRYWRPYVDGALWKWVTVDLDQGMGYLGGASNDSFLRVSIANQLGLNNWASMIFRALLRSEPARHVFLNRFADIINTVFQPDYVIDRIDAFHAAYELEMPEHLDRWNMVESMEKWEANIQKMRDFAIDRPNWMHRRVRRHFRGDYSGLPGEMFYINPQFNYLNITIENPTPDRGDIQVNTIDLAAYGYPWTGVYWRTIPLPLTPLPQDGYLFDGFDGYPESAGPDTWLFTPNSSTTLVARFVPETIDILGDLNGDGVVNVSDLLILLSQWGVCPVDVDCPADLNDDGVVNVSDLLILLSNWG